MNILYLNTTFQCGGAEKVTSQIFQGMRARGHEVYQIVSYDTRNSELPKGVHVLYDSFFMRMFNRMISGNRSNTSLHISYSRQYILHFLKKHKIDLIHLHNPHDSFLGIEDIADLSRVCPVVWTLHDFWAMTGHCTYPHGCDDRWKTGCRTCECLGNYPAIRKDVAHALWEAKKKAFADTNITFTVPSDWMLTQFNSSYLAGKPCERIYNSLDTTLWKPLDKAALRARHKINPQTKILAFIAADPGKKLKGMDYLLKALSLLPDPESYLLLIAGKDHPGLHTLNTKFQIRHWGYLNSQEQLNEFYSLADLLVNPSVYETFGLTNVEAMACGTPVAAFPVCTMPELITKASGWLASDVSAESLADVIQLAFSSPQELRDRGISSRHLVETTFDESTMLNQFEDLYERVLL